MNVTKTILARLSIAHSFLVRQIRDGMGSIIASKFTNSSTEIRPIKDGDLEKILEVHKEAFGERVPTQVMRYSNKFKNIFYIYEVEGEIVGYIGYYIHLKRVGWKIVPLATAYSVAVAEKMRGRGISSIMYKESVHQLKRNGVRAIYAYVNEQNMASMAAHKKAGFEIIEEIKNLYGQDAGYKMELRL